MRSEREIWKLITSSQSGTVPSWIRNLSSDVDELSKQQKFRSEEKVVDPSYLQFLDQQIALEPRGPEWTEVLKKRRVSLSPYVGKAVITVSVVENDRMATIRIDPEEGKIFDIEEN